MEEPPVESRLERERERRALRRQRRERRRRTGLVWLARALLLALVFFVGLVIGRALEDAPKPGGEQTIVRTLVPETVGPVEEVVTVTITAP